MAKLLKIKTGATTTTDDIVVKKAEQLKTARTINGVPFDGTEDITISIGQAGDAVTLGGYLPDEANTAETVVVRDVNKNINVTSVSADWVQLNTATEFLGIAEVPGKIFFDETHDTLAIVTNNGDVIKVGEDLYMPLVKNNSGVAIPKGYLVMATGSNGDKINVAKAITNGTISFDYIIGVATRDIPNGSESGRVITQGYIKGINTNAWDVGTVLYADPNTPGWWTPTKPELPNYTTATAFVVKKNSSSGIIMVRLYPFNIGVGEGSTSVTVSETAPTESTNGDLWFNSNEGILNVFYADADSSQWVTINDLSKLNIENWEEAYSWGNHAEAGYLKNGNFNINNWDTAFSWGNHLEVGYKINTTNISDNQPSDPKHGDLWFNSFNSNLFMYYVDEDSSQWIQLNNVSDLDLENFNEAYSWGNHAEAGYLKNGNFNINNWDTAFSWGNHANAGYLTAESDTLDTVVNRGGVTNNATINFATTSEVIFNTTSNYGTDLGKLGWNTSDQTLQVGLGNGVVLQLGQETLYVVRNATGSTILNGTPVSCTGVTPSGRLEISPSTGTIDPVTFLGIATQDITTGFNGKVTYFGYVSNLDTRGTAASSLAVGDENWAEGDKLYVHPTVAGKLTNVEPEAPKVKICVASVIIRHQNTGVLFVRPTSNLDIKKLSDVQITSPATGEVLAYNGTAGRWENAAGYLSTSNLLNLNTSIIPLNDNTIDLGSPTKKFRELYLSGSTLFIGSLAIKDNNGEIEFQRNNNGTMVAANIKNEIDFTTIRNRPTTLSGFGITDALTNTTTINGFNLHSNIILTNDHIDIVSETITSSVTLNINNKNRILKVNSSSAITLTIPSNASVPFPINTEVAIIREGSGTVSITPGSGVTLLSTDSKRKIKGQYSSAALLKTASDTWLLIGSIEV
jgi:hypothetical protein